MSTTVWRCLLTLAIIWLVAAMALVAVQWIRPTPRKFMEYVAGHPLQGLEATQRAVIIDHAARLLNGLNTRQRRELKESGILRTFFTQLTQEERRHFLSLTLPQGFRQMLVTLNEMEPAQRKKAVQRTLRSLESAEANEVGGNDIEQMFSKGLPIFNEVASPQVKADFAPVMEEVRRRKDLATGATPSTR